MKDTFSSVEDVWRAVWFLKKAGGVRANRGTHNPQWLGPALNTARVTGHADAEANCPR
ncbi:hypothetical protein T484DRAFT_1937798 [Baffinella frigidus]|nr:hypothetical protein T484DRAFT_1937798 [Cryptophyta sp. CCMP2293]